MGATYQKTIGQPVGKAFRSVEKAIGWNKDSPATPAPVTTIKDPTGDQIKELQALSNQQESAAQLAARRKRGRASTMLTAESATGSSTAKTLLGG
jgi:hypothetical protein